MADLKDTVAAPSSNREKSGATDADNEAKAILVDEEPRTAERSETQSLTGWRLSLTIFGLYTGIFLSVFEISIVSTALVAITNGLKSYGQNTWIINSYLLTYTGFLVIWAQFSEVIGRKTSAIAAVVIFIAFSGACGGARTATQLIVLRAFQGIGGAGMFNMAMVIVAEAVPPSTFSKYVALVAAVSAFAFACGPIIGGAIASNVTWRWVFWLNVPIGACALVVDLVSIPSNFPFHDNSNDRPTTGLRSWKRLDIIGAALFLCLSIFFVTALQEADVVYPWRSALVISFIVISSISLLLFVIWERFASLSKWEVVPVLSWDFRTRRCLGLFMTSFLVGGPFTCAVVQIPQRYQVLNGLDPFQAGLRLLPFMLLVPIGAMLGSAIAEKFNIRPTYALLGGVALQLTGAVCFVFLPRDSMIHSSQYGFQVLLGFGSGVNNAIASTSIPLIVQRKHTAAVLGANNQFRYLGSAVGLAIATSVLNSHVRSALESSLTPEQVATVLQSAQAISALPTNVQVTVVDTFAEGFELQWKVLIALIAAQVPTAAMLS